MSDAADPSTDEVIERRRARVLWWCALGKRVGYGAILAAIVVFVIGVLTNFGDIAVALTVASFAISALTLIPATIFGYGVKMAEREERGEPFGY